MKRTALVTGGTKGIGAAIARALRDEGYAVSATYHGDDAAAAAFTDATGVPTFKWDVADFDACAEGVSAAVERAGPIDVLVNNAGITHDGMLHKAAPVRWRNVIDTNLVACFNMCRLVVPDMRARGYGRIVNISSINAQKGQVGQTNYAAAKAGMIGFTKALALESAAKGITVNALAPGFVDTDMVAAMPRDVLDHVIAQVPVGRLGRPEEIARAVVFLASEDASFITGATLSINGGLYMT